MDKILGITEKKKWLLIVLAVIIFMFTCIEFYIIWKQQPNSTKYNNNITEQFNGVNNDKRSLYDLLSEENSISEEMYWNNVKKKDIIENNPWIMIDPINKNASLYPKTSLNTLSGSMSDNIVNGNIRNDPRSYYEFSEVVYTGLPL